MTATSSFSVRSEAGFSLVEVMVSLFVFSLVAAGGAAMLGQSVEAQGRMAKRQEVVRDVQRTRVMLSTDLAQAIPSRPVAGGASVGIEAQAGASPSLAFFRSAADIADSHGPATRLVHVRYFLEDGRLTREVTGVRGRSLASVSRSILLDGASNVRLEVHDGLNWRSDWGGPSQPPLHAVAIIASLPQIGDVRLEALAPT